MKTFDSSCHILAEDMIVVGNLVPYACLLCGLGAICSSPHTSLVHYLNLVCCALHSCHDCYFVVLHAADMNQCVAPWLLGCGEPGADN